MLTLDKPSFPPCQDSRRSPTWSVMIPCYRPSELLRETLLAVENARAQCSAAMQVEIVDDASPDVSIPRMLADWGYSHVPVYRRPVNGGLAAAWNSCIERAQGNYVHILHQDDLITPDFYQRMQELLDEYPDAGMAFCRGSALHGKEAIPHDAQQTTAGPIEGWLNKICMAQQLQCPAAVVRRATYEKLGGFDPGLRFVIDWEMWVRIAAHLPVLYQPEVLSQYRVHGGSETERLRASGEITSDALNAYKSVRQTLRGSRCAEPRRLAKAYLCSLSSTAAAKAEKAGHQQAAAKELFTLIKGWNLKLGAVDLARHVKWYFNVKLRRESQIEPAA